VTERLQLDVDGPASRRWLSVPAEAPIAELLPALVRFVAGAGAGGDGWVLAPPVGRPLDAESTLLACGIRSGSTLCLVAAQLAADADGALPPHALVGMRTPLERTADQLPPPLTGWERVRLAYRLARAEPAGAPALAAGGGSVHPAAFTEHRPAPLWRRGLRAWRGLDDVARLRAVITAPRLRRGVAVAVVSPSAGVGRTVVTALLGTLVAHLRADRVIALDVAPGDRSLAALVATGPAGPAPDLAASALTLTRLDASLTQGYHGLRVLAAAPDPGTMDRLRRFAGLVLVDCGPGLEAPATRAAVAAADQVLVVTDATPRARLALGPAVDLVRREGRSVLTVANAPGAPAAARDAGRVAVGAPSANGLVAVPWCPAGARQLAGGTFDWEHAPGAWRRAAHELAAALALDWSQADQASTAAGH
jgi:MinD-like ATPase involved in chromosome partitioning or flagellar assembly